MCFRYSQWYLTCLDLQSVLGVEITATRISPTLSIWYYGINVAHPGILYSITKMCVFLPLKTSMKYDGKYINVIEHVIISLSTSPNTPGPRESCGHAVFPPLRHGSWPHLSLRLPGRLQRSLAPGAKAGPFLWDIQARRAHLHLQHHDAGDGVRWRHWRERISRFLQCREATYGWFGRLSFHLPNFNSCKFCRFICNVQNDHLSKISSSWRSKATAPSNYDVCMHLTWTRALPVLTSQRTSSVEAVWPNHKVLWKRPTGPTQITQQVSAAPGTSPSSRAM